MPYMYILQCSDGTFYTGSTWNLDRRLIEHNLGIGANYTRARRPLKLVYCEEYDRIDDAFYRERQIHNWSHGKKQALVDGKLDRLKALTTCKNESRSGGKR